jgi:hypothetical protein
MLQSCVMQPSKLIDPPSLLSPHHCDGGIAPGRGHTLSPREALRPVNTRAAGPLRYTHSALLFHGTINAPSCHVTRHREWLRDALGCLYCGLPRGSEASAELPCDAPLCTNTSTVAMSLGHTHTTCGDALSVQPRYIMHYSQVSATDVMTAAAAAQHAQQVALAKAAYDAAVAQYDIDEALRSSSLDIATRRKDCVKCVVQ